MILKGEKINPRSSLVLASSKGVADDVTIKYTAEKCSKEIREQDWE